MHFDLARVALSGPDPFGLHVWEAGPEHVGSPGVAAERAVDDRLAAPELGEGVGTDSELPNAPARAFPGVGCAVPGGLVGRLPFAVVPISFASQSRVSGAFWRWIANPVKLSVREARSPACPVSASGSAADWVTTITCP